MNAVHFKEWKLLELRLSPGRDAALSLLVYVPAVTRMLAFRHVWEYRPMPHTPYSLFMT
jgi:hypothetical protein